VARTNYPRTSGKIERFFGEGERRIQKFGPVQKGVIKPHTSLGFDEPVNVFGTDYPERIPDYALKGWT
jgi:hypothetical protein